jgi:hypothetical protein
MVPIKLFASESGVVAVSTGSVAHVMVPVCPNAHKEWRRDIIRVLQFHFVRVARPALWASFKRKPPAPAITPSHRCPRPDTLVVLFTSMFTASHFERRLLARIVAFL